MSSCWYISTYFLPKKYRCNIGHNDQAFRIIKQEEKSQYKVRNINRMHTYDCVVYCLTIFKNNNQTMVLRIYIMCILRVPTPVYVCALALVNSDIWQLRPDATEHGENKNKQG